MDAGVSKFEEQLSKMDKRLYSMQKLLNQMAEEKLAVASIPEALSRQSLPARRLAGITNKPATTTGKHRVEFRCRVETEQHPISRYRSSTSLDPPSQSGTPRKKFVSARECIYYPVFGEPEEREGHLLPSQSDLLRACFRLALQSTKLLS